MAGNKVHAGVGKVVLRGAEFCDVRYAIDPGRGGRLPPRGTLEGQWDELYEVFQAGSAALKLADGSVVTFTVERLSSQGRCDIVLGGPE